MQDWLKAFYEFFGSKYPTLSLGVVMVLGATAAGIGWQFLRHLYLKDGHTTSSTPSMDRDRVSQLSAPPPDIRNVAVMHLLINRHTALVAALVPYEGRAVGVVTANRADESDRIKRRRVAQQITEIFREAGWQPFSHEISSPVEDYSGIVLVSYKGNTPPANPDFGPIKTALDNQGIPHRMMRLPWMGLYISPRDGEGVTTSDPVIYIGSLD